MLGLLNKTSVLHPPPNFGGSLAVVDNHYRHTLGDTSVRLPPKLRKYLHSYSLQTASEAKNRECQNISIISPNTLVLHHIFKLLVKLPKFLNFLNFDPWHFRQISEATTRPAAGQWPQATILFLIHEVSAKPSQHVQVLKYWQYLY